ncbi:hypothetical protein F5X99DRAFT_400117 [Biscogniauxia marginata]|nr:hypothetical protein F5X99DRAFT_400117 [Biscogniauxia marginata]
MYFKIHRNRTRPMTVFVFPLPVCCRARFCMRIVDLDQFAFALHLYIVLEWAKNLALYEFLLSCESFGSNLLIIGILFFFFCNHFNTPVLLCLAQKWVSSR